MKRSGVLGILSLILLYFEGISALEVSLGTNEQRRSTSGEKYALKPELQIIKGFLSTLKNDISKLNDEVVRINERLVKGVACRKDEAVYQSCREALLKNYHAKNGVYRIKANTPTNFTNAYCRMTSLPGCSGGGWTMVMKINGNEETFSYSSPFWSNKKSYSIADGETGLDHVETKLPTYWSTPFTQLCVGMRVDNLVRFIPVSYKANSLYDIVADGKFRPTNIPRNTWKYLYYNSSLQYNCGRQGFNVIAEDKHHARVRIGIIGNNEISCRTADSFIGFGAIDANQRKYCYKSNIVNSCGNSAYCGPDNDDKEVRAMGYIFVR